IPRGTSPGPQPEGLLDPTRHRSLDGAEPQSCLGTGGALGAGGGGATAPCWAAGRLAGGREGGIGGASGRRAIVARRGGAGRGDAVGTTGVRDGGAGVQGGGRGGRRAGV